MQKKVLLNKTSIIAKYGLMTVLNTTEANSNTTGANIEFQDIEKTSFKNSNVSNPMHTKWR